MSGTIRSAACMIERGERIELDNGSVRVVEKRYNSSKGRTFLYLAGGERLVLDPLHLVTIARPDDKPSRALPSANAEAWKRYPAPTDVNTGEPVDDWGFAETERRAFLAGAEWQRTQAAETIEQVTTTKEANG